MAVVRLAAAFARPRAEPCRCFGAQEERSNGKGTKRAKQEAKRAAKLADDGDGHETATRQATQVRRGRLSARTRTCPVAPVSNERMKRDAGQLGSAGQGETEAERKARKKETKRLKKEAKRAEKAHKKRAARHAPSGTGGAGEAPAQEDAADRRELLSDLDADTLPTQASLAGREAAEQPRRRRLIKRSREGSERHASPAAELESDDDDDANAAPAAARAVRKAVLQSSDDEA